MTNLEKKTLAELKNLTSERLLDKLSNLSTERLEIIQKGISFLVYESDILLTPYKDVLMPLSAGKVHIQMEIKKTLPGVSESIKPGLLFILNETEILAYHKDTTYLSEPRLSIWIIMLRFQIDLLALKININEIFLTRLIEQNK